MVLLQYSCASLFVSKGDIGKVCKYILNQKTHHQLHNYQDERDMFIKFYQQTIDVKSKQGNYVFEIEVNHLLLKLF